MATAADWVAGARPRTLVAGVAPVLVGTMAAGTGTVPRFVGCLLVALGLQVAVNYVNDVADARRGIDAARQGPTRLVASGRASPRAVWVAAGVAASIAAASGIALSVVVGSELLVVGALALVSMLGYSAGPRPYASLGLGELLVLIWFGFVATIGTAYVHAEVFVWEALHVSLPVGLPAVAIMLANNVRDLDSDTAAGKRTLCVRIGRRRSIALFRAVLLLTFASLVWPVVAGSVPAATLFGLVALPLVAGPWRQIESRDPAELVAVLKRCAVLQGQVALGLSIGFVFA